MAKSRGLRVLGLGVEERMGDWRIWRSGGARGM